MKKNIRLFAVILTAAVMALSLSACAGSKQSQIPGTYTAFAVSMGDMLVDIENSDLLTGSPQTFTITLKEDGTGSSTIKDAYGSQMQDDQVSWSVRNNDLVLYDGTTACGPCSLKNGVFKISLSDIEGMPIEDIVMLEYMIGSSAPEVYFAKEGADRSAYPTISAAEASAKLTMDLLGDSEGDSMGDLLSDLLG